jgi:hypothetical protein
MNKQSDHFEALKATFRKDDFLGSGGRVLDEDERKRKKGEELSSSPSSRLSRGRLIRLGYW